MDYVYNKYGSNWTTARMTQNYYFWVASWSSSTNPPRICDIWQYAGDVSWNGIDADLNRLIDSRVIDGNPPVPPTPGELPTWLLALLASKKEKPKHIIFR